MRMWALIPAGPRLTWEGSTASMSKGRHTLSFPCLACATAVFDTPGSRLPPRSGPRSHKITVTLERTWLLVPAQFQRLPWYLALCMQKQIMRVHLVGICCQLTISESTSTFVGEGGAGFTAPSPGCNSWDLSRVPPPFCDPTCLLRW